MVKDMLDVPKPVTDASSDYSDDFDEASNSDDDGKIIRKEWPVSLAFVHSISFELLAYRLIHIQTEICQVFLPC